LSFDIGTAMIGSRTPPIQNPAGLDFF